jgi:arylsulfatase A-like enzyme
VLTPIGKTAASTALVATLLLAGCGRERAPEPRDGAELRMLEPAAGSVLMADVPRAEIGGETRPVAAAPRAELLLWRREVTLEPEVRFEIGLPHTLRGEGHVLVDAWISAPDPSSKGRKLTDLRVGSAARHRIDASLALFDAASGAEREIVIPIPERFVGLDAWLNAVARPLPAAAVGRHAFGPVEIREGDVLAFGYGVAEEAWRAGFAPVDFRLTVESPDGTGPSETFFERGLDPAGEPMDRRWHDARLDLGPYAGRSVRFVFEHAVLADASDSDIRASLPLIANPMIVPGDAGPEAPRNVIVVSLDTLRAASVGSYGYARDTTPQLDRRVAAAGARVQHAIAPKPFTPPSHMTMLTGLEPCVHGIRDRHDALSPDRPLLAELLRAEGYRTGAFTENAYVVANAGFARGFDRYAERRDEESASPGFAPETFAAARAWLEDDDPRPFLLFIHTYEVHDPYSPPTEYHRYFEGDGLADGVPRRERKARDMYDREIRRTDDVMGEFLNDLEARGLLENTILVVTSDHGEEFREHFWSGHGASLNERAIEVPMLILAPGRIAPGTLVEPPVALSDLVPTLLDLLGIEHAAPFMGRSFASLLTGEGEPFAERPLFGGANGIEGVRARGYKYIRPLGFDPETEARRKKPTEILFDLEADPGERANVVRKRPELRAEAVDALEAARAECEAFARAHPARPADPRAQERDPAWMIHRDDIDRKLRSLGYIE